MRTRLAGAEKLRLAVYRAFADTGRAPDPDGVAEQLGVAPDTVHFGLRRLADAARPHASTSPVRRRSRGTRGYVMGRRTLWRLVENWYDGRLGRGYLRREPAAAAEYLRNAGLSGAFWGL